MKNLSIIIFSLILIGCAGHEMENASTGQVISEKRDSIEVEVETFSIPDTFLPDKLVFEVDPSRDTVLSIGNRGTNLHIPEMAFVDEQGNPVSEPVEISYREYSNAAEIAFSKIPMTFNRNDEEFCFNSSGMFEITGRSNGEDVAIASGKSLEIDYALAKKNPDIDFYYLTPDSSGWELVEAIEEMEDENPKVDLLVNGVSVYDTVREDQVSDYNEGIKLVYADQSTGRPGQVVSQEDLNDAEGILAPGFNVTTTSTGSATGLTPRPVYRSVITGLNISNFGIYNCDQLYRLQNRVNIEASYVDEDDQPITDHYTLSLIDLNFNGAFSLSPRRFECSATGRNTLLLYTLSGKLFMLDSESYQSMSIRESGPYTFKMKDVTETIQSSEELAEHLGI